MREGDQTAEQYSMMFLKKELKSFKEDYIQINSEEEVRLTILTKWILKRTLSKIFQESKKKMFGTI